MAALRRVMFAVAGCVVQAQRLLKLQLFDLSKFPLAMCNDGTASGFYFSASPSNSATWIVHQQGGDWCFDKISCQQRLSASPALTGSKTWAATKTASGILNSSDPVLADANIIYAPYCSSDGWIGDAPSSTVGFDFTFNMLGSHVVDALLGTLVSDYGLGSKSARFLYSGCSAGARGVLFNLPRVPRLLVQLARAPLASFGALLDSAFWLDMQPYNTSVTPFAVEVQGVYGLAAPQSKLNPTCLAKYPGAEGWKCMMGQYLLPFIGGQTPIFFHSYQYDAFQLGHNLNLPFGQPPVEPGQLTYTELFRNNTRAAAEADLIQNPPYGTAGMMPACFKHCNTESEQWATLPTLGVTLETAVSAWFSGLGEQQQQDNARDSDLPRSRAMADVPQFIVDNCDGLNCGVGCPAV